LGTIGVSPLLEEPPKSYDEYKDHDVVLDPFYHDVPKIKHKRRKRQVKHSDVIRNEQEAVDVLKFLFDWYQSHEKTSSTVKVPIDPEDITEINEQLAPIVESPELADNQTRDGVEEVGKGGSGDNFRESALFKRKSKFNIVGDVLSVTEKEQVVTTTTDAPVTSSNLENEDYVDDNYEAVTHNMLENEKKEEEEGLDDDRADGTEERETEVDEELDENEKEDVGALEKEEEDGGLDEIGGGDKTYVDQGQVEEEPKGRELDEEYVEELDKDESGTGNLQGEIGEKLKEEKSGLDEEENITELETEQEDEKKFTTTEEARKEDQNEDNMETTTKNEELSTTELPTTTITMSTTTTTTTTTTENPWFAQRRSRERARQAKIMNESKKKYSSSYLSRLRPRIHPRGRTTSTTEAQKVEDLKETTVPTPEAKLDSLSAATHDGAVRMSTEAAKIETLSKKAETERPKSRTTSTTEAQKVEDVKETTTVSTPERKVRQFICC
jgi:hypothetical protein